MERDEIERRADAICDMYDRAYFEVMNKILDQVRAEANIPESTQRNLGQEALRALGLPKIQ